MPTLVGLLGSAGGEGWARVMVSCQGEVANSRRLGAETDLINGSESAPKSPTS